MACHDSKNGTVPCWRARRLPRIIRFSIDFFSVFSVCHTKVKVMAIIVYSVRKKKNKTHIQLVMSAERNSEVRSSISTTKNWYLLLFRDGLQAPVLPNQPPVFCNRNNIVTLSSFALSKFSQWVQIQSKVREKFYEMFWIFFKMFVTTLKSMMIVKLSLHGFWHCHENGLTKTAQTIPHNLYVSFKSASLY